MASRLWHLHEQLKVIVPDASDISEAAVQAIPPFVTYCATEEALKQDPWTEADEGMAMMPMGPDQARAAQELQQRCHDDLVTGKGDVLGYAKWISSGSLAPGANPLLVKECTTHTGSRVWEGALVQMQWIFSNMNLLAGRSVLELGAGCGLLGLSIAKAGGPREVVISDFDGHFVDESTPSLVSLLLENAEANLSSIGEVNLGIWNLDWDKPFEAKCCLDGRLTPTEGIGTFDVILGSELLYSVEGARQLVAVLPTLLADTGVCYLLNNVRRSGVPEFAIGCASVQLACEELEFEKPEANSVVYTMGDSELANDFVLFKVTRAIGTEVATLPTRFVDSNLPSRVEFEASLRLPYDERRKVEMLARLRACEQGPLPA